MTSFLTSEGSVRRLARRKGGMGQTLFPYLLVAPSAIALLLIVGVPLFEVVRLSFMEDNFLSDPEFVGLGNYTFLLFQDARFWQVVRNTVVWTASAVTIEFSLGLAVALMLNTALRFRSLFRALFVMPWVVPPVTAALIWLTIYDAQNGIFNQWLGELGLPGMQWLSSSTLALPSLVLVAAWKYTPFMIVGLLAGLQSVPRDLYEAAALDGASRWATFRYVTAPALAPIATVLIVLSIIWRAGHFDLVYMLTGGGPGASTELVASYAVVKTLERFEAGMGAAVALLGVLGIFGLTGMFLRRLVREV